MMPWDILSEIARTVLITSLTGGIITLLLFALKPIIKNRLPKSVQYYLWLLALVAFLVPFSRFVSIPVSTPITSVQTIIEENVKSTPEWQETLAQEKYNLPFDKLEDLQKINIFYGEIGYMERSLNEAAIYMLSFGWFLAFMVQAIEYCIYIVKLRRKRMPPLESETTVLRSLCEKTPRLYRNPLAPTPMLVGIFKPVIYLPDIEYSGKQLENILLHELTHLRRKDVVIKWIAAMTVYLHWFNPLAWLMRRELDRACELSCDEAVIKNMDSGGKQSYGDTLIAMAADTKKSKMIVSTTMCEEKKTLKTRLGAIMKHKRFSAWAMAVSCVLVISVFCGTVVLGASATGGARCGTIELSNMTLSGMDVDDIMSRIADITGAEGEIYCAPSQIHLSADFEWDWVSIMHLKVDDRRYQLEVQADTLDMELFLTDYDPMGVYPYRLEHLLETLKSLPVDEIKERFDLLPDKYNILVRQDLGMYLEILPMYAADGGGYSGQGSDVIIYPAQQSPETAVPQRGRDELLSD